MPTQYHVIPEMTGTMIILVWPEMIERYPVIGWVVDFDVNEDGEEGSKWVTPLCAVDSGDITDVPRLLEFRISGEPVRWECVKVDGESFTDYSTAIKHAIGHLPKK